MGVIQYLIIIFFPFGGLTTQSSFLCSLILSNPDNKPRTSYYLPQWVPFLQHTSRILKKKRNFVSVAKRDRCDQQRDFRGKKHFLLMMPFFPLSTKKREINIDMFHCCCNYAWFLLHFPRCYKAKKPKLLKLLTMHGFKRKKEEKANVAQHISWCSLFRHKIWNMTYYECHHSLLLLSLII